MATSASGNGNGNGNNVNINNLNIITFIKDIYLSLKHIDARFSNLQQDIDSRIIKIEGQYVHILERVAQIENTITTVSERVNNAAAAGIDSALEKELLDKMYKLSSATEDASRLELKPKELTIANVVENGYSLLDINNSLAGVGSGGYQPIDLSADGMDVGMGLDYGISNSMGSGVGNNAVEKKPTLDSLLFD